jgi:hypothetical protein
MTFPNKNHIARNWRQKKPDNKHNIFVRFDIYKEFYLKSVSRVRKYTFSLKLCIAAKIKINQRHDNPLLFVD